METPRVRKALLPDGKPATAATLRRMAEMVKGSDQDRLIKEVAAKIIADIPSNDYAAQVKAVFLFVRNNLKYIRDISGVEEITAPGKILRNIYTGKTDHSADCDDHSILLAALLRSIGFPMRFAAIASGKHGTYYDHVRAEAFIEGRDWLALEATIKYAKAGQYYRSILPPIYLELSSGKEYTGLGIKELTDAENLALRIAQSDQEFKSRTTGTIMAWDHRNTRMDDGFAWVAKTGRRTLTPTGDLIDDYAFYTWGGGKEIPVLDYWRSKGIVAQAEKAIADKRYSDALVFAAALAKKQAFDMIQQPGFFSMQDLHAPAVYVLEIGKNAWGQPMLAALKGRLIAPAPGTYGKALGSDPSYEFTRPLQIFKAIMDSFSAIMAVPEIAESFDEKDAESFKEYSNTVENGLTWGYYNALLEHGFLNLMRKAAQDSIAYLEGIRSDIRPVLGAILESMNRAMSAAERKQKEGAIISQIGTVIQVIGAAYLPVVGQVASGYFLGKLQEALTTSPDFQGLVGRELSSFYPQGKTRHGLSVDIYPEHFADSVVNAFQRNTEDTMRVIQAKAQELPAILEAQEQPLFGLNQEQIKDWVASAEKAMNQISQEYQDNAVRIMTLIQNDFLTFQP